MHLILTAPYVKNTCLVVINIWYEIFEIDFEKLGPCRWYGVIAKKKPHRIVYYLECGEDVLAYKGIVVSFGRLGLEAIFLLHFKGAKGGEQNIGLIVVYCQ